MTGKETVKLITVNLPDGSLVRCLWLLVVVVVVVGGGGGLILIFCFIRFLWAWNRVLCVACCVLRVA